MSHPLKLQDILREPSDNTSELSYDVSFTLQDILNEKMNTVADKIHNDFDHNDLFLDDDFDEHESSIGKQMKSIKNTITQSNSKNKSRHEATNSSNHQTLALKRIKRSQKQIEVDSILHHQLNKINRLCFEKKAGLPSAITTLGSGFLIVGTTLAHIIIFQIGEEEPIVIKPPGSQFGSITALSVSKDQIFIAAGCDSGFIFVIDKSFSSISKIIPPEILNVSIIKLLFVGDDFTHLIKNDAGGNVYVYTLQRMVWQVGVIARRLVPHSLSIVYYDVRTITVDKKKIVCLSTHDFVICLMFFQNSQPQIIGKAMRPHGIKYKQKIPNIDLGFFNMAGQSKLGLFVSWSNSIHIYYYNPLQRHNRFIFYRAIELDSLIEFQIYSFYQLTQSLIVIIDSRECFQLVNIQQNPAHIYYNYSILEGIVSQRLPSRTNRLIKCYSNTISKATIHHKDIYYISGTSIYRARLLSWGEYIRYLWEIGDWNKLLRQCIEIYHGRIHAFSDVFSKIVDKKQKKIFETVILKYIDFKFGKNQKGKEVISEVIQFCLEIGLYKLLFKKIFQMFQKQGYNQIFIQQLEPFIQQNMVLELPNDELLQELMVLWSDSGDKQILEALLVQLNKSSMDYLLTIQLCRKYNLYLGLLYVSQIHNDFITPLNRLIEISQKKTIEQNKDELIGLIYDFISKTSNCTTITGNKTLPQQSIRVGLPRLVLWLLIQQNMEWLIDYNSELYFNQIQNLLKMDLVKYYIDSEFEDANVVHQLFKNCQILLERMRTFEVQARLAHCLLSISFIWSLTIQQSYYMLKHCKNYDDFDLMVKYIDIHYVELKLNSIQWQNVVKQLPEQIRALIMIKQNQEAEGLQLYERNKNRFNIKILFNHLTQGQLLKNIDQLLKIDSKMTAASVFELQTQRIPKYVRKVSDSLSRYQLMRYLFKLDLQQIMSWSLEDLTFYFTCLCRFRQQYRVIHELNKAKKQYQFYEAYKTSIFDVTKTYKLSECQAFLSKPEQAFIIYKKLYEQTFQKNFQKLLKFDNNNAHDLKKIFENLLKTLDIYPQGSHKQNIWFQLVEIVLSPLRKPHKRITIGEEIQKIYKMKESQNNQFLRTLRQIMQEALFRVASHTTISQMTQWMQGNNKILELKFVIDCLCSTLKTYDQQNQTLVLSNEVLESDIIQTFKDTMKLKVEGVPSGLKCMICDQRLIEDRNIVFRCGHGYHQVCCSQINLIKCKVCLEFDLARNDQAKTQRQQEIGHNIARSRSATQRSRKASQQIFLPINGQSNLVYALNAFDQILLQEQQQYQKFKDVYESYMMLY